MKFSLDTEFMEDGRSLTLLSIALVAEDGREYYAEIDAVDLRPANAWVRANVLIHMGKSRQAVKPREQVRHDIIEFVGDGKPVFWAWYAAFDWVLFTQLIGDFETYRRAVPEWPLLCFDLQQASVMTGEPLRLPEVQEHHSLSDARCVMTEVKRLAL